MSCAVKEASEEQGRDIVSRQDVPGPSDQLRTSRDRCHREEKVSGDEPLQTTNQPERSQARSAGQGTGNIRNLLSFVSFLSFFIEVSHVFVSRSIVN